MTVRRRSTGRREGGGRETRLFDHFIFVCVQVHIEFTDGEERISLEGPTEEVEQAQAQIQEIIKDLVRTHARTRTHKLHKA